MDKLGVDLVSILAQVVNFGILVFVLNKFVFKTVIQIVELSKKRTKETEDSAQKVKQELENLEKNKEKEMLRAKREATGVISQAKQEAESQKREIVTKAKNEAREIIKEAQVEIKNKEAKMKEGVKEYSANLAVKIASRLIAEFLDKEKQRLLIKRAITNLKKVSL